MDGGKVDDLIHHFVCPYDDHVYEHRLLRITNIKKGAAMYCLEAFLPVMTKEVQDWYTLLHIRQSRGREEETGRQRKEKRLVVRYLLRSSQRDPVVRRILDLVMLFTR